MAESRLPRIVLEGTMEGKRSMERPRMKSTDNIKNWTQWLIQEVRKLTNDGTGRKKITAMSADVPLRSKG
jgi:hypothetical protein